MSFLAEADSAETLRPPRHHRGRRHLSRDQVLVVLNGLTEAEPEAPPQPAQDPGALATELAAKVNRKEEGALYELTQLMLDLETGTSVTVTMMSLGSIPVIELIGENARNESKGLLLGDSFSGIVVDNRSSTNHATGESVIAPDTISYPSETERGLSLKFWSLDRTGNRPTGPETVVTHIPLPFDQADQPLFQIEITPPTA